MGVVPGARVTPEQIRKTVNDFFAVLEAPMEPEARVRTLQEALDRLALAYHASAGPFDPTDQRDPVVDDAGRRERLRALFPDFGWYNEAEEIAGTPAQGGLVVGDALDDLDDIARELSEVLLRWDSTSEADALWHLWMTFETHWGKHLRSLQLYIHARAFYPATPSATSE